MNIKELNEALNKILDNKCLKETYTKSDLKSLLSISVKIYFGGETYLIQEVFDNIVRLIDLEDDLRTLKTFDITIDELASFEDLKLFKATEIKLT